MSRPVTIATRPQTALQSYLDALLDDATQLEAATQSAVAPAAEAEVVTTALVEVTVETLAPVVASDAVFDEFAAAVREEAAMEAMLQAAASMPVAPTPAAPMPAAPMPAAPIPIASTSSAEPAIELQAEPDYRVAPVAEVNPPVGLFKAPPPKLVNGRPEWAQETFECLLFDVAGLTLAVPLVCLGSIYSLAGQTLTPLFGQPNWFLGLLPGQSGNLKVLDTARWIMPDRYRDDLREGLRYVISVQGYEWGLAVHDVSRSLRLHPDEVKWRGERTQRPWLAGTVIEHMCALLDVSELAELITSGAIKHLEAERIDAAKRLAVEKRDAERALRTKLR